MATECQEMTPSGYNRDNKRPVTSSATATTSDKIQESGTSGGGGGGRGGEEEEEEALATEGILIQTISNDSGNSTHQTKQINVPPNMNTANTDVRQKDSTSSAREIIGNPPKEQQKVMLDKRRATSDGLPGLTKSWDTREIDAILARKMSSTDLNSARPKKKISAIGTVVEEPASWRTIGESEALRRTKCRRVYAKLGQHKDLALFYRAGKFFAMTAWCSHMGGPLYEGDIEDYKGSAHVMCPWHAYMFDLSTGNCDIGLKQDVFPVRVEGGQVQVEYTCDLALYPFL
ncbi:uncharacterized protein LOC101860850 [Aplysia californica]|uniref:Uncharacterized protein LOC101860850 n=1 Tax=Aplysia californica TaxID=6500 RepID=A0ABM1W1F3_APLCA|nr:uncharacterized protein LOC101860850 [Aplysia californica]